jgi:hypothetical protein
MKRVGFLVGLVVLVFGASIWAQTQAPKPDLELKKFDVFLGHWAAEIEYKAGPLGPGGKSAGDYTVRKILGGFFFQNQWAEKSAAGEARGIEIIGYDPANKVFFSSEYHDDGSFGSGAYVSDGNAWSYSGKFVVAGKPYLWKMKGAFSPDLMSFTGKCDISADGKTWEPFDEFKFTKVVKAAPKAK